MSNIAIKQHVKRRTRAEIPVRSFLRFGGPVSPAHTFQQSPSHHRPVKHGPAGKRRHSGPDSLVPARRAGRGGGKKIPLRARPFWLFFFGEEGLFPLPAVRDPVAESAGFPGAEGEGRSGFPLSPFIAAALTVIVSVAAINWKFPLISSVLGDAGISLGAAGRGGEAERILASYAGLNLGEGVLAGEDEEIPLDLTEVFSWKEYRVKGGDTLSEIARDQQLDMGTLIASNGITNARRLREGEVLRIPNMDGIPYTVKAGDSLAGISSSSSVPLQVILDVNDLQSDVINPGAVLFLPGARMPAEEIRLALGESFIYPVRGVLSSSFGWRVDPIAKVERFHSAIDLAAPLGTPVKAPLDGRVSRVAVNSVYGNYIIITHQGSYQTLYAHLSAVSVAQGAWVTQNSKIGEVGSTGYSTGPHLHFSVFRNNKAINPLEVLPR
jgi:murein DD-endopeptidase MepM/ murein hydrolase activator NlpD